MISTEQMEMLKRKSAMGEITKEEIELIANEIVVASDDRRKHQCLIILGDAYAFDYTPIIENYLEYPSFPYLSATALKILCRWWGETSKYEKEILTFLYGVVWDTDEFCLMQAISICGEYLYDNKNPKLLGALIERFDTYANDLQNLKNIYSQEHIGIWDSQWLLALNGQVDTSYLENIPQEQRKQEIEDSYRYTHCLLRLQEIYTAFAEILGYSNQKQYTLNFDDVAQDKIVVQIKERLKNEFC